MEYKDNIRVEFNDLIELFNNKGIPDEYALKFINSNIDFLYNHRINLLNKLFFVFNKDILYAVVYADDNDYYFSILRNNQFTNFSIKDINDITSSDYVIETVLNFADTDKLNKINPNIKDYNNENKFRELKRIRLNSKGYHIK